MSHHHTYYVASSYIRCTGGVALKVGEYRDVVDYKDTVVDRDELCPLHGQQSVDKISMHWWRGAQGRGGL